MNTLANRLRLIDSTLFSTREDPGTKRVVEAQFFVDAQGTQDNVPSTYKLTAMTTDAFDAWSVDRHAYGGPVDEEDVYPLVVSPSLLVARGLVEFVEDTYLDPRRPEAVSHVAQFLLYVETDSSQAPTSHVPPASHAA